MIKQNSKSWNAINFLIDSTIERLIELRHLKKGWDFGAGEAIEDDLLHFGIRLHMALKKTTGIDLKAEVLPKSDGGYTLSYKLNQDDFIDITVNKNQKLDLTYEKGIGAEFSTLVEEENTTIHYITDFIISIAGRCESSEPFQSINFLSKNYGSRPMRSQYSVKGFLYSKSPVQSKKAERSAITLIDTTHRRSEFLLSS